MKNFVQELTWRGMLHTAMPDTETQLQKEVTTGYAGFDPTAASLHIGNLVPIMLLKHFQLCGHKPVALVGGATGMIGDPSGKAAEREFLSEEVLRHNQACIHKQLAKFLDFEGENKAEIVNNYDWFKEIGFLQFLREAGKHLTVNYMMAKDSVKNRLETGISFTEFSYQLLQAYDFYWLYTQKNCKLQVGGSDQWGNITSGTELIRRKTQGEAYALTCPLLTKADGSKFGKSEKGNIWLDPAMTSPYQFYQFWLNAQDEDISKLIRFFSLLSQEEILALEEEHQKAPEAKILQKALAKDVTIRVHSLEDYEHAVEASQILFGKGTLETLKNLDENTLLTIFEGVPQVELSKNDLENCVNVVDLLSTTTNSTIFNSKSEVKRAIQGNSLSINKIKITQPEQKIDFELLQGKYLLVQNGKKNYYLLTIS